MRRKKISAGRKYYSTSSDGSCTTWSHASIGWTARLFDDLGHLTNEVNSAGMIHSADWESNCCGKASDTDATGVTTEYQYDDLLRVKYEDRELGSTNVITGYDYDLANRRICTTIQAGDIAQVSSNSYDTAGRMDYSIDAQGIETIYEYSADGLTNVTIRAGLTNTTVRYLGGRTYYTDQNGVRQNTTPVRFDARRTSRLRCGSISRILLTTC